MKKTLKKAFSKRKITVSSDKRQTYFNFMRPDGKHCEFYVCGPFLSASYSGKEFDIDTSSDQGISELVSTVSQILK